MNIFSQRLIVETACGHNGSIKLLKKLINIAKNCGAKTIKFQIFDVFERLFQEQRNGQYLVNSSKKKKLKNCN